MPIYEDIARDLIDAIDTGRYPVGALMPTEIEIAAQYGVSRQTVRAAMRRLTELGAVSRRKRSGTRVEAREAPSEGFQQTLGSLGDLVELAAATRRELQRSGTVVMDRATARRLGCAPGSRWLHIAYLRLSGNPKAPPIAWVDVYVDEAYADALGSIASDARLVCDIIAARYGVIASEVHQSVMAAALREELAGPLGAEAGAPALDVLRRYFDPRGRLFEISESVHPADRSVVTSVLRRVSAATSGGGSAA